MEQNEIRMYRHGFAHVLAKAIMAKYPNAKLAIGPAIDNGCYYDIDLDEPIKEEDYKSIEKGMEQIINKSEPIVREVVSRSDALKLFANQPYKIELINEIADTAEISIYRMGDFADLCAGPHIDKTSKLANWGYKISSVTGAYWRGSEKNKMLKRIYLLAFPTKKELFDYETMLADALKRDHNKLGRELDLFTTVDYIGQGLPIMLPKGARMIQILQRFVEDEEQKRGYLLTKTPFLAKSDLYKISGHWDHYRDGMFVLGEEEKDKEVFAMRPMTCPFQFQVYLNRPRSYRDLPMRLNETSTLFRNESSGEMHGLIRLRQFTISEGHIACTPGQLEDEFKASLDLARFMLASLGIDDDVSYRFSKWDPNNKAKYIGSEVEWDNVQNKMREILNDLQIDYYEAVGEAAFYGPKLDIQIKNVFGKEDTLITIQIDFQLAERFGMEYVDADGEKKYPYVIHRTSIGCYERTLALLIEKYAGAFPTWLAPVQVKVMNISESSAEYAKSIFDTLAAVGLRIELDDRNEKIGYKIREASKYKIPYMIVVGDSEKESNTITIRMRGNVEKKDYSIDKFVTEIMKEIALKSINLTK